MTAADAAPPLHHVTVVGGTLAEWSAMSTEQWAERLTELGKVADHMGARWLTLRPFEPTVPVSAPAVQERTVVVGVCTVTADPECDGRSRIARAVEALRAAGEVIDEASLGARLNAPAETDPDLVVVLGAARRLPSSLVWELAYSELVFLDTTWQHLGASHLEDAVASYAHRHRRFGGVD